MKLISNDLRDGDKLPHRHVFNGMGYDGDNISPHLAWDDVPAGTKSFVVTCYDPDAPTGSGWWHWVVVNLPADTRVLPQGFGSGLVAMPDGVLQTRTDFGKTGYDGAALMNPLMILVKIIKLRWIHILSYDQMVSRKINNQTTRCANSIFYTTLFTNSAPNYT